MTDFLSSALGYFSNSSESGGSTSVNINGIIQMDSFKLRVKKVIAEGGFSTIYSVQNLESGKYYAMKKVLAADEEAKNSVLQEIEIFKKISNHPNIVLFFASTCMPKSVSSHGQYEFLILMELCSDGTLADVVSSKCFDSSIEIISILFYQVCLAIQHLHQQNPSIIHRDIKLENFLLGEDIKLKLCDFGSATTKEILPDETWSAQKRSLLEDEIAHYTTPMYRSPEQIDTWSNYKIGKPCDVWAAGCILYTLCFKKHPFEDSAKLAILNANFSIPVNDHKCKIFHPIIKKCLKVNPRERYSINDLLESIAVIAETNGFKLNEHLHQWSEIIGIDLDEAKDVSEFSTKRSDYPQNTTNPSSNTCPISNNASRRDLPSNKTSNSSNYGFPSVNSGNLFSQLRGGAGSLFKNIKDTSSKVVLSVQSSMTRSGVDISYITSRVAVMSYPGEGLELTSNSNCAEDVRAFLEAKHYIHYCVYNISGRSYSHSRIGRGGLMEYRWSSNSRRMPSLPFLYGACRDMFSFLDENEKNVCIIHCMDGKSSSAILASAFLMFVGFVSKPENALQVFAVKRAPPNLQPSEIRAAVVWPRKMMEHFSK